MISRVHNFQGSLIHRVLSAFISFSFILTLMTPPQAAAQIAPQTLLNLPAPGAMLPLSNGFHPAIIKGLKVDDTNPLLFDFIVDHGEGDLSKDAFRDEAERLVKYFLTSLTVPDQDLWVNLSPYEKDRIIPEDFGVTEMGRDMLAQDYLLKQLTASLVYPEDELGQKFWSSVYQKAQEQFGTTDIPVNTFNKVWIVPESAMVWEHGGIVYVVERKLKVMLEEDYLALKSNMNNADFGMAGNTKEQNEITSGISSEVVRDIVIPAIEKEVNEGEHFAQLRQIYNSMILATWYKKNLKDSLLGQVYFDQNKVKGVDIEDREQKLKIYNQYLEAFKTGVFDYIREDVDSVSQDVVPRKYFSGGLRMDVGKAFSSSPANSYYELSYAQQNLISGSSSLVTAATIENIDPTMDTDQLTGVGSSSVSKDTTDVLFGLLAKISDASEYQNTPEEELVVWIANDLSDSIKAGSMAGLMKDLAEEAESEDSFVYKIIVLNVLKVLVGGDDVTQLDDFNDLYNVDENKLSRLRLEIIKVKSIDLTGYISDFLQSVEEKLGQAVQYGTTQALLDEIIKAVVWSSEGKENQEKKDSSEIALNMLRMLLGDYTGILIAQSVVTQPRFSSALSEVDSINANFLRDRLKEFKSGDVLGGMNDINQARYRSLIVEIESVIQISHETGSLGYLKRFLVGQAAGADKDVFSLTIAFNALNIINGGSNWGLILNDVYSYNPDIMSGLDERLTGMERAFDYQEELFRNDLIRLSNEIKTLAGKAKDDQSSLELMKFLAQEFAKQQLAESGTAKGPADLYARVVYDILLTVIGAPSSSLEGEGSDVDTLFSVRTESSVSSALGLKIKDLPEEQRIQVRTNLRQFRRDLAIENTLKLYGTGLQGAYQRVVDELEGIEKPDANDSDYDYLEQRNQTIYNAAQQLRDNGVEHKKLTDFLDDTSRWKEITVEKFDANLKYFRAKVAKDVADGMSYFQDLAALEISKGILHVMAGEGSGRDGVEDSFKAGHTYIFRSFGISA